MTTGYQPLDYISAALDPRLKFLTHLPASHARSTFDYLRNLERSSRDNDIPSSEDLVTRLGGNLTEEVDRYISDSSIGMEENPLVWWAHKEGAYPFLAKLAMVLVHSRLLHFLQFTLVEIPCDPS